VYCVSVYMCIHSASFSFNVYDNVYVLERLYLCLNEIRRRWANLQRERERESKLHKILKRDKPDGRFVTNGVIDCAFMRRQRCSYRSDKIIANRDVWCAITR